MNRHRTLARTHTRALVAPALPKAAAGRGILIVLAALAPACSGGGDAPDGCASGFLPGDLVITEIMADPPGADEGHEWFEVYNATSTGVDLAGLDVVFSRTDGTEPVRTTLGPVVVSAGAYAVLGNVLPGYEPAWMDAGYGVALGQLRSSGGRISLECNGTVVDRAVYAEPSGGASLAFDGGKAPDALANDDLSAWCAGTTDLGDESFGSPGKANLPCSASKCVGPDGTIRDAVAPEPGDVVVTEILANPTAKSESKAEWVEVLVLADIDLNGLQLGASPEELVSRVDSSNCQPRAAGERVVFAGSLDPGENQGLPQADFKLGMTLANSGGSLLVGYAGTTLDAASWQSTDNGRSWSLDPDFALPDLNDDPKGWCPGAAQMAEGNMGTPGQPNPYCPGSGKCKDGNGRWRAAGAPESGDIVISEILADPAKTGGVEWVELYLAKEVELGTLQVGKDLAHLARLVDTGDCDIRGPGYVVLADPPSTEDPSAVKGDLPLRMGLTNGGGTIMVAAGGEELDSAAYGTAAKGFAFSLDPDALTPLGSSDPANWCKATGPALPSGDVGSPGKPNPHCVGADECLGEDGLPRAIAPPPDGSLRITEVMANAGAVSDEKGDWLELRAAAGFDLNGLQLGKVAGKTELELELGQCEPVAAGSYLLFARSAKSDENGGLENVTSSFPFSLVNEASGLFVAHRGVVMDQIEYPKPASGIAWSRDPDDSLSWCAATTLMPNGDSGTPGAPNPSCP